MCYVSVSFALFACFIEGIFAFTIGGLLFLLSLAVGMPGLLGRDPFPRGQIVSEDRERAPLLADD